MMALDILRLYRTTRILHPNHTDTRKFYDMKRKKNTSPNPNSLKKILWNNVCQMPLERSMYLCAFGKFVECFI